MTTAASTNFEEAVKKALADRAKDGQASPAPELNGLILQLPGAPDLYLVLNGYRRLIPNSQTLQNLFVPNETVVPDINIGLVSQGENLTAGAALAQSDTSSPVFLVSNGVRMWVPNMDIFNRYQFSVPQIRKVPQVVIDYVPNGPQIEGPKPLQ